MNDSTIRPGAGSNGGGDNSTTIRPGTGTNGATIRPGMSGTSGMSGNSRTSGTPDTSKTTRLSGSAGNAGSTLRQGATVTQSIKRSGAKPTNANNDIIDDKNKRGAIYGRNELVLDGKNVKVVEYLPQISGEAQLIKVEIKHRVYMLKLYFGNIHPDHKLLDNIKNIPQGLPGLMRLLQHGTWTNPDDPADVRDYEIMQLCEGGMLSDLDIKGDEEKWKKLAMQMACSIDLCHQRGFIHLDVKPENFLFADKEKKNLVLGDFGLAVPHDNNGKGQSSQARTKKYAAPEIYIHLEGEPVDISVKSDFYSLGLSLMRMWMGQQKFDDVLGNKNERQLMNMKLNGKVPLPEGLSDHSLSLIKALLIANTDERAGFADIQRWWKGENLCPDTVTEQKNQMNLVFNGAKNQVAHSLEDLAYLMTQEQELAKKYLYSGKLSKMLETLYPEIVVNLDEIVEEWYPTDKDAGLAAAVYTLDDSLPYVDRNHKSCYTFAEIAHSLLYDFDAYVNDLKNPNDLFYVYLRVNKEKQWGDKIYNQLSKGAQDNLLMFIYEFNGKLPFRITTDDGKMHYPDTIDGILQYGPKLSKTSQWEITCGGFTTWLNNKNALIGAEVQSYLKSKNWSTDCYLGVLYRLNKNCDYNFNIVSKNDSNAQYSPSQLAQRLNNLIALYGKGSNKYQFFEEFRNIKETRLEYYLTARQFTDHIKYIQYCFDLNGSDNNKKPGPYNEIIAAYKCIAAFGYTPYYKTKSGKIVKTLAEVENLSSDEKRAELNSGTLADFLAVLHQENPDLKLNQKYTYELETEKYLKCICRINNGDNRVRRFEEAVRKTHDSVKSFKGLLAQAVSMKVIVALLGLVPITLLALYFLFVGLPFISNPLEPFNQTIFSVLLILCVLICFGLSEGEGGCIGNLIIGAIAALALYYGLKWTLGILMPMARYILAGLLALYAFWLLKSCFLNFSIKSGNATSLGTDELVVAPLHFAFRSTQDISDFIPTVAVRVKPYEEKLRNNIKSIRRKTVLAVITSILLIGMIYLMGGKNIIQTRSAAEVETLLKGTWNGEFEGRPATLIINKVDTEAKTIQGMMYVKFKSLAKEEVSGTYINESTLTVNLKDDVSNGILDGNYTIYVDETNKKLLCNYVNTKTDKNISFELTKDENAAPVETSTPTQRSETTSKTGKAVKNNADIKTKSIDKSSVKSNANDKAETSVQPSQENDGYSAQTKQQTTPEPQPKEPERRGGFRLEPIE